MPDSPITAEITRLITAGTSERDVVDAIAAEIRQLISAGATQTELIAVVAYLADLFPDMTPAQLSQALQVAMAAAERKVTARH
jgi:hypothetical protein